MENSRGEVANLSFMELVYVKTLTLPDAATGDRTR